MFDPLFIDRLAWTFSHQPELYAKHLAAPEAPQSAIVVATAAFMDALGKDWDTKTIYHYVVHALEVASQKGVWMEKTIRKFFETGYKIQPYELKMTLWPGAFIYSGMKASSEEEVKQLAEEWSQQLHLGKPGYYNQQIALQIYLWRNGKEQELTWTQTGAYGINRPWKCIEAAHDYWSALDNAFRADGYAPYTGIIVGALAEAKWRNTI